MKRIMCWRKGCSSESMATSDCRLAPADMNQARIDGVTTGAFVLDGTTHGLQIIDPATVLQRLGDVLARRHIYTGDRT